MTSFTDKKFECKDIINFVVIVFTAHVKCSVFLTCFWHVTRQSAPEFREINVQIIPL